MSFRKFENPHFEYSERTISKIRIAYGHSNFEILERRHDDWSHSTTVRGAVRCTHGRGQASVAAILDDRVPRTLLRSRAADTDTGSARDALLADGTTQGVPGDVVMPPSLSPLSNPQSRRNDACSRTRGSSLLLLRPGTSKRRQDIAQMCRRSRTFGRCDG